MSQHNLPTFGVASFKICMQTRLFHMQFRLVFYVGELVECTMGEKDDKIMVLFMMLSGS